ncbi:MAG TPA: 1-acyl-sn-glycerol-3-phosphate acyltransferase [Anaerolineae bacterium]|nr:1-acyl-sn-glycerol-3-phosphate acyltransferase [Anaerolineae bacterium]
MTIAKKVVNYTFNRLTSLFCRINADQLALVPTEGPLIVVANHVNFLEVPVLVTRLGSRSVTGFAKIETWDNPVLGYIFDLWEIIPIQRGEADVGALREGLRALRAGKILAIAPEGTRSGHGRLQRGHPGVVLIALRSGAPLLPLAYYGGEEIWQNLSRLRRTNFNVLVGRPFYLSAEGVKVTQAVRQQMTDEIMWQLAALLPAAYRGHYANLSKATEDYLRFPPTSESNLLLAM